MGPMGRDLIRPSQADLDLYRTLLEDLVHLDGVFNRLALTIAQTGVSEEQRSAALMHLASTMRGTARINALILGWCLGETNLSILFPAVSKRRQ